MAKTVSGYSSQQIWLHWVTVALVAVQMIFHEGISRAFSTGLEEGALYISPPVILHFLFGSAITFLVMWRLMLRNDRGVPGPPEGEPQIFPHVFPEHV